MSTLCLRGKKIGKNNTVTTTKQKGRILIAIEVEIKGYTNDVISEQSNKLLLYLFSFVDDVENEATVELSLIEQNLGLNKKECIEVLNEIMASTITIHVIFSKTNKPHKFYKNWFDLLEFTEVAVRFKFSSHALKVIKEQVLKN